MYLGINLHKNILFLTLIDYNNRSKQKKYVPETIRSSLLPEKFAEDEFLYFIKMDFSRFRSVKQYFLSKLDRIFNNFQTALFKIQMMGNFPTFH